MIDRFAERVNHIRSEGLRRESQSYLNGLLCEPRMCLKGLPDALLSGQLLQDQLHRHGCADDDGFPIITAGSERTSSWCFIALSWVAL